MQFSLCECQTITRKTVAIDVVVKARSTEVKQVKTSHVRELALEYDTRDKKE